MRKIRADLVGVVMAGGQMYSAGAVVPDGIDVHDSLLDEASGEPEAPQEGTKPASTDEAPAGTSDDPKDGEEDFSDLLGEEEPAKAPQKPAPKASAKTSGRQSATKKS